MLTVTNESLLDRNQAVESIEVVPSTRMLIVDFVITGRIL
jgi:hypothetical protein